MEKWETQEIWVRKHEMMTENLLQALEFSRADLRSSPNALSTAQGDGA
jgi:hypothetical protein